MATRVARPEFIGRRHELDALTDAVRRGTDGDATVVLVGGDAGIGTNRGSRRPQPTGISWAP